MKKSKLIVGMLSISMVSGFALGINNVLADSTVVGGDSIESVVSGSTGGKAPEYKSNEKSNNKSEAGSGAVSDLGTRSIPVEPKPVKEPVKEPDNAPSIFNGSEAKPRVVENQEKPKQKDTKASEKSTSTKTDTNDDIQGKKNNTESTVKKKETKTKSSSKKETTKPKKKQYNTSGKDGSNMTLNDLIDKPEDIEPDQKENQTTNPKVENNNTPEIIDPGQPATDENVGDVDENNVEDKSYLRNFIYPQGLELETKRLNETRMKILEKCTESDSFLMNKAFFSIYGERLENDMTHYDSMSPIILNKRTGNKSQYITKGEFALLIDAIVHSEIDTSYNLPLVDTVNTIFDKSVTNVISKDLMDLKGLMAFDTYNLVTWGEFKDTFEKLNKMMYLKNNDELPWNYDYNFYSKYKNIYSYQINPDTFISKTMLVGLLTGLMSEYSK